MVIIENYCRNPQNNEWRSLVKCESCAKERIANKYSLLCGKGDKYCNPCSKNIYFDNSLKEKIKEIENYNNVKNLKLPSYTKESVDWRCNKGHIFKTSVSNFIKNRYGCLVCNGKAPKDLIEYQKLATKKNCKFIGPIPPKVRNKTFWECGCGNITTNSYAVINRLKERLKCDECKKKELLATEELHRLRHKEILKKIKHITTEESWGKLKISANIDNLKTIKGIIYLFQNKINNKRLVGQTLGTFTSRYRGKPDKWVQYASGERFINALIKYGIENFDIKLLETNIKTRKELNILEKFYIKKYKSNQIEFGYNITEGGEIDGYSPATIKNIYIRSLNRKNEFIEKCKKIYPHYNYDNVVYNGRKRDIENILCTICGLRFSYAAELHFKKCLHPCPTCKKLNGSIKKQSFHSFLNIALNKHGEKYEYDASSYINSHKKVRIFCNTCCKWFEQEARIHLRSTYCCPYCKNPNQGKRFRKPINQINPDTNEIINSFCSITEARYKTGFKSITNGLISGKKAYGFLWKYV